jgi:hypothetical protein
MAMPVNLLTHPPKCDLSGRELIEISAITQSEHDALRHSPVVTIHQPRHD